MPPPSLSDILKTAAHQIDKRYGQMRAAAKRRLGWVSPVTILPYRGYGTGDRWYVMGRVLEDKPIGSPREEDSVWNNMRAMYQRFAADEIAGVGVRASIDGHAQEGVTDEEGYYRFRLCPPNSICSSHLWHPVHLELLEEVCPGQGPVSATGRVLIPSAQSHFGVISDVDDTIIRSHATDFLKMAFITFINNARTRTPLAGVPHFYQALARGHTGQAQNPFFYVSSSAWNLYDLLSDFLELHEIPAGPILLRDLGIDDEKFIKSGHDHKLQKIRRILDTYDPLPFVLIGDAGQEDSSIYRDVVRHYPGRVLAVYIRTVPSQRRNRRVTEAAANTTREGVPMLLVEDGDEAMRHAADLGLIAPTTVA